MKKFELTTDCITFFGRKLFRIRALIELGDVKAGETGGYVEKEENLSQSGNAWVYGNAEVYGNALVYGDARVYGNARICGDALVYGDARICGDARVYGDADYTYHRGYGSEFRTTTFFRLKDGRVGVRCGCFYGTLEEFRKEVREKHGDSKLAREYLLIADLEELHYGEEQCR